MPVHDAENLKVTKVTFRLRLRCNSQERGNEVVGEGATRSALGMSYRTGMAALPERAAIGFIRLLR